MNIRIECATTTDDPNWVHKAVVVDTSRDPVKRTPLLIWVTWNTPDLRADLYRETVRQWALAVDAVAEVGQQRLQDAGRRIAELEAEVRRLSAPKFERVDTSWGTDAQLRRLLAAAQVIRRPQAPV